MPEYLNFYAFFFKVPEYLNFYLYFRDNTQPAAGRNFVMTTFNEAKVCDICGKLLRGTFFQGYTDPGNFLLAFNPFQTRNPISGYYENSADPVQMPQNVASDQSLHCLLIEISMESSDKMETSTGNPLNWKWTHPNDKDRWSKKG